MNVSIALGKAFAIRDHIQSEAGTDSGSFCYCRQPDSFLC
jgi:hypothetical protein